MKCISVGSKHGRRINNLDLYSRGRCAYVDRLEEVKVKYKFVFPIAPVAQARPRASRTKFGVRMYDPVRVKQFKLDLGMLARQQWHQEPLQGPLKVTLEFYRGMQKSLSKKEQALRLSGAHRPIVKPDLSNYIKSFEDGLNGLIWADDNEIVEMVARKYYSDHPRIEVEIEVLEED